MQPSVLSSHGGHFSFERSFTVTALPSIRSFNCFIFLSFCFVICSGVIAWTFIAWTFLARGRRHR